jgi:hypothetical protein
MDKSKTCFPVFPQMLLCVRRLEFSVSWLPARLLSLRLPYVSTSAGLKCRKSALGYELSPRAQIPPRLIFILCRYLASVHQGKTLLLHGYSEWRSVVSADPLSSTSVSSPIGSTLLILKNSAVKIFTGVSLLPVHFLSCGFLHLVH